jgi:ABC-type dipeptide/oligopeptide/nickel transport system permease component
MAAVYFLLHGGSLEDLGKLLAGLSPASEAAGVKAITVAACARTLVLICSALLTAFATALALVSVTSQIRPTALGPLSILGRLLFAAPALGLISAWSGWWIGSCGGVIETLMPPRPNGIGEDLTEILARHLWTWLAPILALSLPLTGLLLTPLAQILKPHPKDSLSLRLRARGVPTSRIMDRHLLPLHGSLMHRALEAALFAALGLTIVVEYTLDFPGWGTALINGLQNQDTMTTATGIHASGIMLAIVVGLLRLFRPQSIADPQPLNPSSAPITNVATSLALGLTAAWFLWIDHASTLHHACTRLATGDDWLHAWKHDAQACLWILQLALIAGSVLAALRLTILGDWLRRYGSLETLVWSPLPVWALAWSHTSGHVISIDLALAMVAAVTLSIHLHANTRRYAASPLLQASRSLGATSWQAWRRHALFPWSRDLAAFLFILLGSSWWLRITSYSLLATDKIDPLASIGSFLAHASTDSFHHPLPLLSASLAAAVSILFLWTLGRIIPTQHPDDA